MRCFSCRVVVATANDGVLFNLFCYWLAFVEQCCFGPRDSFKEDCALLYRSVVDLVACLIGIRICFCCQHQVTPHQVAPHQVAPHLVSILVAGWRVCLGRDW